MTGPFESPLEALTRAALTALTHHWGDAYAISESDGAWQARRADGLGEPITAVSPELLREAIRADYEAHPVPHGDPELSRPR